MPIKVVVNYPEDPEIMEEIDNRLANAALVILKNRLGEEKLDEFINYLKEKYEEKENE